MKINISMTRKMYLQLKALSQKNGVPMSRMIAMALAEKYEIER